METSTSFEDHEEYTIDEFVDYMSSGDELHLHSDPQTPNYYVFYHQGIGERIKQGLQDLHFPLWRYPSSYGHSSSVLIQFWDQKINPDGRVLTTSCQPFALWRLYKGFSWYRKHCTSHDVPVEKQEEELLGPLGRVFLNGQPESSPDLRCYSGKEFPLRDYALSCGMRRYMALPVFELRNHHCLGVLELLCFRTAVPLMYFELCGSINNAFQREGQKLALSEIRELFRVTTDTPHISVALAWTPCAGCSGNCDSMDQALCRFDREWNDKQYDALDSDFTYATSFHKLQKGKGVAGRTLSSIHKACFCPSLYGFNIKEYPVAHYARKDMFTVCFAICLQSAHTGSDPYVLEFYLRPGNFQDGADPRSLIQFLLIRMKQLLLSFQVASGLQLGEELVVEIIRFPAEDHPVYLQKRLSDRYPLEFKVSEHKIEDESPQPLVIFEAENQYSAATSIQEAADVMRTASSSSKIKRKPGDIRYDELESQFGKPRKEAADNLRVSESTFKRACKFHGIDRWQFHPKSNANRSLYADKSRHDTDILASCSDLSTSAQPNLRINNQCSITLQDTSPFTIKAKYKSKTYKFQLCISSGMAKLEQELAKRIKLKIGEFEISYQDEEDSSIHLTCDEDFKYCVQTLTASGCTTVQLSVE